MIVTRVWVDGVGNFVRTVADNFVDLGGRLLETSVVGKRRSMVVKGLPSAAVQVVASVPCELVVGALMVPPPIFFLGALRGGIWCVAGAPFKVRVGWCESAANIVTPQLVASLLFVTNTPVTRFARR